MSLKNFLKFGAVILACGLPVATTLAQVEYTVTPSIGPNGSVSPSTPQTVADGTSVASTFTADSGYELESLGGCDAGTVYSGTQFARTKEVRRTTSWKISLMSLPSLEKALIRRDRKLTLKVTCTVGGRGQRVAA